MWTWSEWIGAAGSLAGVVGVGIAVYQVRRTRRIAQIQQELLFGMIGDIGQTADDADGLSSALHTGSGTPSAKSKSIADSLRDRTREHYSRLLHLYLDGESSFPYERLDSAQRSGRVTGTWQLASWRRAIAERPENRQGPRVTRHLQQEIAGVRRAAKHQNDKT